MGNKFFQILRKKLSFQSSENFDKAFWAKFDSEFHRPKTRWSLWAGLATAGIAGVILIAQKTEVQQVSEQVSASEMVESQELLKDIELFSEFDDDLAIEDEDWDILLGETNET